jgi:UDP-N-acetylmuramate-alanine ligase
MSLEKKRRVNEEALIDLLTKEKNDKEVIMTLGAGDIDLFVPKIKALLKHE